MEVLAPKPGNVYPGADWNYSDLTTMDFLKSANAIRKPFDQSACQNLGDLILSAVSSTQSLVQTNTNLGQILLLAPLVKASAEFGEINQKSVEKIISVTTAEDSNKVYQAIALAKPGGMGQVDQEDIHQPPSLSLRQVMALASQRDTIALQYTNGFSDVLDFGMSRVTQIWANTPLWTDAVVRLFLEYLACIPDSLISRKCGQEMAHCVSATAREILNLEFQDGSYQEAIQTFDRWLRDDGNRRNPGTTADLVTATLFVAIQLDKIPVPPDLELLVSGFFSTLNGNDK
jgi:triphosphoribosyl-dephospho-CoA synthase